MFDGSNCDQKLQLSGILTEPLNYSCLKVSPVPEFKVLIRCMKSASVRFLGC